MDHAFLNGVIESAGQAADTAELPWNPHPSFPGVNLKHLLASEQTGGSLSLHLVRIDPGCAIGSHVHETQDELHLVLEGRGDCLLNRDSLAYAPGAGRFLPRGEPHEVRAGDHGLLLAALFTPALP